MKSINLAEKNGMYKYPAFYINCLNCGEEMWNNDNKKLNITKRKGYKIFVVWENDYKNNPSLILKESKKFLLSNEQLILF